MDLWLKIMDLLAPYYEEKDISKVDIAFKNK